MMRLTGELKTKSMILWDAKIKPKPPPKETEQMCQINLAFQR